MQIQDLQRIRPLQLTQASFYPDQVQFFYLGRLQPRKMLLHTTVDQQKHNCKDKISKSEVESSRAAFVFTFIAGQNFFNRWNLLVQSVAESGTVVGQDCQRLP
jgi:hypothetical protein